MRVKRRADTASDDHPLSGSIPGVDFFRFTAHPTADVNDPDAVLTVRSSPDGEPTEC